MQRKGNPQCTVGEIVHWCSHYGKQYRVSSNKLKIDLPYDSAILLLGIYLKKIETLIQKDICTTMFIALFTIVKIWKQPKCPSIDEWIKMMQYIQVHTIEYYSVIKKNEILPFATTWMDLEGIMLSEISQTEKDKCCMLSLICII